MELPKKQLPQSLPRYYKPVETFSCENSPFLRGTRGIVLLSSRVWKDVNGWALEIGISCTYSNPVVTGGRKHTHTPKRTSWGSSSLSNLLLEEDSRLRISCENSPFLRGTRGILLLSSRVWKDVNGWALEIGISCTYSNPVVTGCQKHTHTPKRTSWGSSSLSNLLLEEDSRLRKLFQA